MMRAPAEVAGIYQSRGYVHVAGAFDPGEAVAWASECDRLLAAHGAPDPYNLRTGLSWRPTETTIERLDPVVDVSPIFAALARDPRVVDIVRALLGEEPVLLKDKLIYKLPGMGGYAIHQDASWWQESDYVRLLSLAVAIDPAGPANGGLELYPGHHHRLLSAPGELRDMTEDEAHAAGLHEGDLPACAPGDLLAFSALTPHRSARNPGPASRRLLYLTYGPARGRDTYDDFAARYRALCLGRVPLHDRHRYGIR